MVDLFFLKMQAIYPYRWSGQFDSQESLAIAKGEWKTLLQNLSEEKIIRGLEKCKRRGGEFPPSIPAFYKMCFIDKDDVGLISEPEAFTQYIDSYYKNPVVEICKRLIDRFSFNRSSIETATKIFSKAYHQACKIYLEEINAR